jgi:hypothetical protein
MPAIKKNKVGKSYVEDSIVDKIEKIRTKKKNALPVVNNSLATKKKKNKDKQKLASLADLKSDSDDASTTSPSTSLMLKDVIDLGGTQDDYDMLQNVSDDEAELEIYDVDGNFDVAELITFMKSNGLKTAKKVKEKHEAPPGKIKELNNSNVRPKVCPLVPSDPTPHERLLFKANEPW